MTGTGGLNFVEDLIKKLKDDWRSGNGGKLPQIEKQWEIKQVGTGTNNYDVIIINIDTENIEAFSLQYIDEDDDPAWDWLHDMSLTLDVRSSISELRVLQIINEITRILKKNVMFNVNNRIYIQLLINGATSMNEEYKNMYKYLVSCDAKILNP